MKLKYNFEQVRNINLCLQNLTAICSIKNPPRSFVVKIVQQLRRRLKLLDKELFDFQNKYKLWHDDPKS